MYSRAIYFYTYNFKEEQEKMEGTVKWFHNIKGFGFINGEDDVDYFVHHTSLPEGLAIKENDKVTFDTKDTERGVQAQNVVIVE